MVVYRSCGREHYPQLHQCPALLCRLACGALRHRARIAAASLKAKLGPWTLATVRHLVAVLSTAHRLKQATNPCEQPAIRTVLSRAARAARAAVKRGERPRKKTAITLPELEALLATRDDRLEGIRDRALLCFGFASGGRRRSEIVAAYLRDLCRIGEASYIYRLEHSKTQQAGVTASSTPDKPVLDRAALALEDWLEASGSPKGRSSGGYGNSALALPCPPPR